MVVLHTDYAVEAVVAVLHIDALVCHKGHHVTAAQALQNSLDTAPARAIEVVDVIALHTELAHDSLKLTNRVAVVAEDIPDFPGEHFLKDYKLGRRRNWDNLPYWHWLKSLDCRSSTLLY